MTEQLKVKSGKLSLRNLTMKTVVAVLAIILTIGVVCGVAFAMLKTDNEQPNAPGKVANTPKQAAGKNSSEPKQRVSNVAPAPEDDSHAAKQPSINMDKATAKLDECVHASTVDRLDGDKSKARRVLRECFYSSAAHQDKVYALRSIGDDVKATKSVYDTDSASIENARDTAKVVTEFRQGKTVVGWLTCYWDVRLMQCKLQEVMFSHDGDDLYNRSVRVRAQSLM